MVWTVSPRVPAPQPTSWPQRGSPPRLPPGARKVQAKLAPLRDCWRTRSTPRVRARSLGVPRRRSRRRPTLSPATPPRQQFGCSRTRVPSEGPSRVGGARRSPPANGRASRPRQSQHPTEDQWEVDRLAEVDERRRSDGERGDRSVGAQIIVDCCLTLPTGHDPDQEPAADRPRLRLWPNRLPQWGSARRELTSADPAVRAGQLEIQTMAWLTRPDALRVGQ